MTKTGDQRREELVVNIDKWAERIEALPYSPRGWEVRKRHLSILAELVQEVREEAEHDGFIQGMDAVRDSITGMRNARFSMIHNYERLKEAARANTRRLTGQDAISQPADTPTQETKP